MVKAVFMVSWDAYAAKTDHVKRCERHKKVKNNNYRLEDKRLARVLE